MLKFIKILSSILGLFVLLVMAALLILVTVVNPNDFKSQLSEQVHHYTGRDLSLKGNIAWSFFPWLGLKANDATLSNVGNFGPRAFAHIDHADIKIKFLPLLHRQIEVGTLVLDGLEIHLIKNIHGVPNWQGLSSTQEITNKTSQNSSSNDSKQKQKFSFSIAAVDITDGYISFEDKQKHQALDLTNLELHSKNIQQNQSFPVNLQFTLQSKQPEIKGSVQIKTSLLVNPDQQKFLLKDLFLISQLSGSSLPKNQLNLNLQGDVAIDNKQHLIEGQLQTKQFELGSLVAQSVVMQFKSQNGNIALDPILAKLYQGDYTGNMQINLSNKTPKINTHMQLTNIQAEPLFKDLATFTSLQLSGTGNLVADLTTQGDSTPTLLKNLNGQGNFALHNGVLHGINLPYWIGVGRSLTQNESLPSLPTDLRQTDFGNLTGTFTVVNGLLRNNDLLLKSIHLQATGQGTANLVNQQIDYRLQAQLLNPTTLKPQGAIIPVAVNGSFNSPLIRPEMNTVLKNTLKEQYQKNREVVGKQLKKFLGKDTGEKIQQGLESLLH